MKRALSPWSHPRARPGHTRSLLRKRWWRWHPQNSGSTFCVQISDRQHQIIWKQQNRHLVYRMKGR
jgi:hypothetical protein